MLCSIVLGSLDEPNRQNATPFNNKSVFLYYNNPSVGFLLVVFLVAGFATRALGSLRLNENDDQQLIRLLQILCISHAVQNFNKPFYSGLLWQLVTSSYKIVLSTSNRFLRFTRSFSLNSMVRIQSCNSEIDQQATADEFWKANHIEPVCQIQILSFAHQASPLEFARTISCNVSHTYDLFCISS